LGTSRGKVESRECVFFVGIFESNIAAKFHPNQLVFAISQLRQSSGMLHFSFIYSKVKNLLPGLLILNRFTG
jgi:hypothetical protein